LLQIILQGFCYILISSRGGIIACVFANLITTSKINNENIEFTVPTEDDILNHVNPNFEISETSKGS